MSDLQKAINKLRSSPHYKELADYEPPFNPFEIAGVTHRELTHSSVLAWLLRDEVNREFRQRFVAWIRNNTLIKLQSALDSIVQETSKKTKEDLINLQELRELWTGLVVPKNPKNSSLKPKIVRTEKGDKTSRIDVFAHFESLNLVIGIEVKVWAGEQDDQIKRYQEFLCRFVREEYSGSDYKKVIIFLTPGGYLPKTKSSGTGVPVLEMPWSDIALMIGDMRAAMGNENDFRMQFSQHLEKHLTVNETEGQRIVRELLSEDSNLEIIKKVTSKMETWDDKKAIEGKIDGFSVEMVQKIIADLSFLQTSLEYEFWRELKEQLDDEYEKSEFQLYQSGDLKSEVIEDGKLDERVKEYIKWGYGGSSPGLTFRVPGGSLDKDHEVVCRITYDTAPISHLYYGFVLCKKDNIGERVEIKNNDEYDEKCRDLLGGKMLDRGPDKKHGWLRWKLRTDVNIYFANGPKLFDTLVKIKNKERKKEVVGKLVTEIREVINNLPKQEKGEQH